MGGLESLPPKNSIIFILPLKKSSLFIIYPGRILLVINQHGMNIKCNSSNGFPNGYANFLSLVKIYVTEGELRNTLLFWGESRFTVPISRNSNSEGKTKTVHVRRGSSHRSRLNSQFVMQIIEILLIFQHFSIH